MSLAVFLTASILGSSACDSSKPLTGVLFTHVRSPNRYVRELIREGYDRSPTFRLLVDTLQQSNMIVMVTVQPAACAHGRIRSCLVSVDGSAAHRFVRIRVDPHTTNDRLIATIAHELQHAVEIAEHPDVIDGRKTLELYRRIAIGRCHEGMSEECETARALIAEKQALDEFSRCPRSLRPR